MANRRLERERLIVGIADDPDELERCFGLRLGGLFESAVFVSALCKGAGRTHNAINADIRQIRLSMTGTLIQRGENGRRRAFRRVRASNGR